jgi:biotin transport system substrate-specific component
MQQRTTSLNPTLIDLVWPASEGIQTLLRSAIIPIVGSGLLTLSAKTQVPFYPVPMTLQTAVVFLLGIALGWRLAVATVVLYLLEGAIGLPVFAGTPEKGIGLAYMAGPTGGYLMGFVVAAAITGWAAVRFGGAFATALSVLLATCAIYVLGVAWLVPLIGPDKALTFGVAPFLLGDLVKLVLVVALAEVGLGEVRRRLANG